MKTLTLWHGTTETAAMNIASDGQIIPASDLGKSRDKYAKPRKGRIYLSRTREAAQEYADQRTSEADNDADIDLGLVEVEVPIDQLQPDEDVYLSWVSYKYHDEDHAKGWLGEKGGPVRQVMLDIDAALKKDGFKEPGHPKDPLFGYKAILDHLAKKHPELLVRLTELSDSLSAPGPIKVKRVIIVRPWDDEEKELPLGKRVRDYLDMPFVSTLDEATGGSTLMKLPTVRKKRVFHVGALDQPRKQVGGTGLEGNGLSVSEHPEEWRTIARLGDHDTWLLEKVSGGVFVDVIRTFRTKAIRKLLMEWAKAKGLVEPATMWKATWYDDEFEQEFSALYDTEEEAIADSEDRYDEDGEPAKVEEVKEGAFKATQAFSDWYKSFAGRSLELSMVDDMVLFRYAEETDAYDGLWWNEDLDELRLSAPRGSIFQSKLDSWTKKNTSQKGTAPGKNPRP